MHYLFNAFMDLIFYNHKKRIIFAFFYVDLQVTDCLALQIPCTVDRKRNYAV